MIKFNTLWYIFHLTCPLGNLVIIGVVSTFVLGCPGVGDLMPGMESTCCVGCNRGCAEIINSYMECFNPKGKVLCTGKISVSSIDDGKLHKLFLFEIVLALLHEKIKVKCYGSGPTIIS